MGEVCGNGLGDKVEDARVLLAASFNGGEHRLHEPAPGRALCAKRELPPNHRVTQRALAGVVGRLDPFHFQKGPQAIAMIIQRAAHASSGAGFR